MKHWHFVGIGGIGMSGLAQMALAQGFHVSGSDRGRHGKENAALFAALERQGARLFEQDGSFLAAGRPDAVIYSTAIEENNPDFAAAPDVPRLHRAEALRQLIAASGAPCSIAVAGSAGKTSTAAFCAEALYHLGADPACINGGHIKAFADLSHPGNFRDGAGPLVFEADESDKSLLAFEPDYAIILNIGTDHYSKEELADVFAAFLARTRRGAVLESHVYETLRGRIPERLAVAVFDGASEPGEHSAYPFYLSGYEARDGAAYAAWNGGELRELPVPGRHTALNLLAVTALLKLLGYDRDAAVGAVLKSGGVARRFDRKGIHRSGAPVIDDYAHNPEKIACCIRAAQELAKGRVWTVFQPHGYGPLGFMRDELGRTLGATLRPGDRFFLLEPYYAGGTSSFRPHADEAIRAWRDAAITAPEKGESRDAVRAVLDRECRAGDMILVLGARDNTLPEWAAELADSAQEA